MKWLFKEIKQISKVLISHMTISYLKTAAWLSCLSIHYLFLRNVIFAEEVRYSSNNKRKINFLQRNK